MSIIVKEPEKKKPTPWAKYTWVKASENNYTLRVAEGFLARIYADEGLWRTAIKTSAGIVRDTHFTLEDAAKFADRKLYKALPKVWTQTDVRAIISLWKGDLTFEEAKG